MRTAPHPVLAHGEFFGRSRARAAVAGFDLAHRSADPHLEVRTHTHETAHFVLVTGGAYVSSARGAPALCAAPTLIYNPPGTTHRDHFRRPPGAARVEGRFFSVAVDAERMARIEAQVPLVDAALRLDGPDATGLAVRLARECRAWDGASPLAAEGLALELVACVARRAERLTSGGAPPRWLGVARELLEDRCADDLSIAEVARACGVHPVHLARTFRRFLGCSPGAYLRRCRLSRAAALLRDGRLRVSEVALGCGFADQSHLTTAFRRAHGVTPAEYRRLLGGGAHPEV